MRGRLGRALRAVLHVDGTPHRTAMAFAIGVFIAFSPLLGLHTGMALAVAFAFRLSRVALLTGAYINNPWTLGPMYMAGTLLGCTLLSVPAHGLDAIDWSLHGRDFYATLLDTLRPFLWPYVIGNTALGAVAALAAYLVMRTVLERRAGLPTGSAP